MCMFFLSFIPIRTVNRFVRQSIPLAPSIYWYQFDTINISCFNSILCENGRFCAKTGDFVWKIARILWILLGGMMREQNRKDLSNFNWILNELLAEHHAETPIKTK